MSECEHRFVGHIYDVGLGIEFYYCHSCKKTSEEVKLEEERDDLLKQNADYDELGLKHLALLKERDELKSKLDKMEDDMDRDYLADHQMTSEQKRKYEQRKEVRASR